MPALGDWLNQLREYVASLHPRESVGTVTDHTTQGVFRKSKPGEESAASASDPVWLP